MYIFGVTTNEFCAPFAVRISKFDLEIGPFTPLLFSRRYYSRQCILLIKDLMTFLR